MFATRWVAPKTGARVGLLWDKVMLSGILLACDGGLREAWEGKGKPTDELRRKVTRLEIDTTKELQAYDAERAYAAIWEYD